MSRVQWFQYKTCTRKWSATGHKTGIVYIPFLDMVPAEPDTMKNSYGGGTASNITHRTGVDNFN